MAQETTRLWCPSCAAWVVATRGKPNRWGHGFATILTGGTWGVAWLMREGYEAAKRDLAPGWSCTRCGYLHLRTKAGSVPSRQRSTRESAPNACPKCQYAKWWDGEHCDNCGHVATERIDNGSGTYRVVGIDRESHNDVEQIIEAKTIGNAKAKAELAGIVVTEVRPVEPRVESRSLPPEPDQDLSPAMSGSELEDELEFVVEGVGRSNGSQVSIVVRAESEVEAARKATEQGIAATSIRRVAEPPSQDAEGSGTVALACLAFIVVVIAIYTLLF